MNVDSVYHDLIQAAKNNKNNIIDYNDGLTLTCIPDIIDRVEWFYEKMHISASYAKILIERSLNNE